jgi:PmbA protein
LEDILASAKKVAQEAEIFLTSYEVTPVVFEANRLKQLQTRQGVIVALRIIREGKIGFSTTTRLDDREALVSRAVEVSQFGAPARFELPHHRVYPQVEVYDPEVEAITIEQMVDLGESIIDKLRGHTPELVCEAEVTKGITSVRILNSRGGEAGYKKSVFVISVEGTIVRDTDMLFVGDSDGSCHPISEVGKLTDSVINQLELAKKQNSLPSGHLPVIFTPHGVASALVAQLASAFNGKVVSQGVSPLGDRQGEQVFDKKLSLWDDATITYRLRSRPFDDEGVFSQRTTLIDNGVVKGFLYDLQTASLLNAQSTGNGDRGRGGLPAPSVSALVFGQGDTAFEDMVREIKLGLVVEQLMGAEQTNILSGEFRGNVLLGYKVENGEMVGRVKNTVLSGNIYKVLDNLAAVGREARWVGGSVYAPAIYCSSLVVASKD